MDIYWGDVTDVALLGVGMAVVASLLWVAYRTMDHPRLPVIRSADRPPRVTRAGVARYLLMTPVLVSFWMLVLLMLIIAVAQQRSGIQITVATAAVIAGARLLAHIKSEISHELAKTVPIVILSVVIIGGQLAGIEGFARAFDAIPWETVDSYWLGLILWDYAITAIWLLQQRRAWTRRDVPPGRLRRLRTRWQRIGYADSSADPVSPAGS